MMKRDRWKGMKRIHLALHGAHLAHHDTFDLLRQLSQYLAFEAAEQEGAQHLSEIRVKRNVNIMDEEISTNLMEALNDEKRLLFRQLHRLSGIGKWRAEPLKHNLDEARNNII